jgi:hypothetical protein
MKFVPGVFLLGLMALALPACAADYTESEPNNDFPPSFLPGNPLFVSGDRLLGQRNPGESDLHYFRFAGAGAPGIYRYELNMTEGEDGSLLLFDASPDGFFLSSNDDYPGNGARPRLFFDHFDPTGAETTWGIEVDGFTTVFDYAVQINRTLAPITSLGMIDVAGGSGNGVVEAGQGTWFSFTTSREGILTLETSGDLDTELALFDSQGNTLFGNDDIDPTNLLSRVEKLVPAGTYYAAIGAFNSSYNWNTSVNAPIGWDRNGFGSFTDGFFSDFETGPVGLNIGFQAAVPEPGSVALLVAGGLSALGLIARRRR